MMELVIGGSGSGKSAYAEERVCMRHRQFVAESGTDAIAMPLYYIADMIPYGKETEEKIQTHRRTRAGKGFITLEWYMDLYGKLTEELHPDLENACVLLECISNLTANEMYEPDGAGRDTVESIVRGVGLLNAACKHLVVVTNDVFRESEECSEEMALYKQNLGAVNRRLAQMADRVTEVVFGIPICVKPDQEKKRAAQMKTCGSPDDRTVQSEDESMIFVTGGAYQGKYDYTKEIISAWTVWADGADCPLDLPETCGAMNHFHLFIRRWLQEGRSSDELIRMICGRTDKFVIVCDEIGCGLVPADDFDRAYREAAGRICTEIVKHAGEVHRVVCGAGTRLR
nr:bifunctional adenosylcobinamide kinase/adenosylcobinamide-phosphate guanylyltransferase [uncultured Mediterraneibacter sp.]